MCGIVALVRRPREIKPDELDGLEVVLETISHLALEPTELAQNIELLKNFAKRSITLEACVSLVRSRTRCKTLFEKSQEIRKNVESILLGKDLTEEQRNQLIEINDALWRISRDACAGADEIALLLNEQMQDATNVQTHIVGVYRSLNLVLRSLDRIEVRGRDSAGISLSIANISLEQSDRETIRKREFETFTHGSIRYADRENSSLVYFVYKRAAEIGELGDNVAFLRDAISKDEFLFDIVQRNRNCHETVLAHTRWASMGVISEENTHPLDLTEKSRDTNSRVALGVLNGDIDNHVALRTECEIQELITTDAKLIPVLYSHERDSNPNQDVFDSYRKVASRFEGSTAVSMLTSDDPNALFLALRGGGQGLFVGLGPDEFLVASEPYGVVEVADSYIRVDGETPHNLDQPVTSRGQVLRLNAENAGDIAGIERVAYDSQELPISESEFKTSEVTTRDIDRGEYQHYLWKEINEAPRSFATTLQGKFIENQGQYSAAIHEEIIPSFVSDKITSGEITDVVVIGQGTAAVAGQSCAHFFSAIGSDLNVKAILATELSGFALKDDMSNTLVIAVSQSGTTTDTNRTVDLLRDRKASVIAIVNRRGSDLTTKADGVCYTSSGRDVEMSVASTKAFYAQVAACAYLSIAVESLREPNNLDGGLVNEIAKALIAIPDQMREVLKMRETIEALAQKTVLSRRSWATVGNGPNVIAAREIRIKSSELCYKAIAMDSTEDKKHIDLSSEPLIMVCATGLEGSTADDVAKEVAIYSAHKACPVVITDDKSERFDSTDAVITVPKTHKSLSFILATVAGHIFGYESARAIDSTAKVLREARGALATLTPQDLESAQALPKLGAVLSKPAAQYFTDLGAKKYDAILDASDASNLTKLFVALSPPFMPDLLSEQCGGIQTPQALANCAVSILTRSIDQLTRPIDAIRHQAKTVTVGISRSDDTLLKSASVSYLLTNSVARDYLQYPVIRTLLALDEMIGEITGHTRYAVNGDTTSGQATLSILEQKGSAQGLESRITTNPALRGTKSLTAREQVVWVTRGKSDNRDVIMIPEVTRSKTIGITLLHIDVKPENEISIQSRKRILEGYKQRLFALRDSVTETNDTFDESKLDQISIIELLTKPVVDLAEQYWNQSK